MLTYRRHKMIAAANRAALVGGGGAFSPLSLSPTVWIENDATKLYTDAGTTLVSADGQAVYRAADKSGNSRHVEQTTLGARPLYKTSGPHLLFDGTDDGMETAQSLPLADGSGQCWLAFVGQLADVTTNQHLCVIRHSTSGNHMLRIFAALGTIRGFNSVSGVVDAGSISINTKYVFLVQLTTSQLEVYVNNGSAVTGSIGSALETGTAALYVANQVGTNYMNGQVRGIITGTGVLSGSDRTNLYNYLNGL
jgi:hypothetical protein